MERGSYHATAKPQDLLRYLEFGSHLTRKRPPTELPHWRASAMTNVPLPPSFYVRTSAERDGSKSGDAWPSVVTRAGPALAWCGF